MIEPWPNDFHMQQLALRLADPEGDCPHVGRDHPAHQRNCPWFQFPWTLFRQAGER